MRSWNLYTGWLSLNKNNFDIFFTSVKYLPANLFFVLMNFTIVRLRISLRGKEVHSAMRPWQMSSNLIVDSCSTINRKSRLKTESLLDLLHTVFNKTSNNNHRR